jgi:hypothetical protein
VAADAAGSETKLPAADCNARRGRRIHSIPGSARPGRRSRSIPAPPAPRRRRSARLRRLRPGPRRAGADAALPRPCCPPAGLGGRGPEDGTADDAAADAAGGRGGCDAAGPAGPGFEIAHRDHVADRVTRRRDRSGPARRLRSGRAPADAPAAAGDGFDLGGVNAGRGSDRTAPHTYRTQQTRFVKQDKASPVQPSINNLTANEGTRMRSCIRVCRIEFKNA